MKFKLPAPLLLDKIKAKKSKIAGQNYKNNSIFVGQETDYLLSQVKIADLVTIITATLNYFRMYMFYKNHWSIFSNLRMFVI